LLKNENSQLHTPLTQVQQLLVNLPIDKAIFVEGKEYKTEMLTSGYPLLLKAHMYIPM